MKTLGVNLNKVKAMHLQNKGGRMVMDVVTFQIKAAREHKYGIQKTIKLEIKISKPTTSMKHWRRRKMKMKMK
ncbi:hypothetical protein H5410_031885 [Solanum commersonii]|uniref:Uncharacterized protein n=1 Tax=Solanum commersonii TaxID=4109 RepID=A0A9J5YIE5_SOLCO|nr:hypothetical protein H5410_031885 [Solanum commersonii]